ncbi:MAG: hypothetical protein IKK93_11785 [Campylobacter sp.]|nr:hypothetical protein [Campylobacter sp.]
MFKLAFIVAVCVAGITEWFKNLLPAKVKENNVAMAAIAAVFGAAAGFGTTFVAPDIFGTSVSILTRIIFVGGVVALTQTSYTLLFQTFKAIKVALTKKLTVNPDSLAEEVASKILGEAEKTFIKED